MISNITLKFGRTPGIPGEQITSTPVIVFVGPNNSGKSRVLTEIDQFCRTGQKQIDALILDDIVFRELDSEDAEREIEQIQQLPSPNEVVRLDHVIVGGRRARQQVSRAQLLRVLQRPTHDLHVYCGWFLAHSTLILDGRGRIDLINDQPAGDLQLPPQSSLQVLFRDDMKRGEVRRIIAEAFGLFFTIDPTRLGQLRIRLANRSPLNNIEERGIHEEAVRFHAAAQIIDSTSDGMKAFTGIITEVIAGDPRVLLIDEPEAFLHPSLAFKLGYEISCAALTADKRVFASTHSPTFVMGCIQSGAPVSIIRLTYRGGVATARVLPSDEILKLMRHPLLRSTNVLSGLFYEFVVVTESDADRAFYQEVNERLLQFKPEWGIPNCLFINAQNKQTIHTIVEPLRQLGIPAAAIVDVDILKEGGTNWASLLKSASMPELLRDSLANLRAAVRKAMGETQYDMKRDGGISILGPEEREAAQSLLTQLAQYGIFIVPGGELESWLKPLGASGHGPSWLIAIFEMMGEDPANHGYIKPTHEDVWEFISKAKSWLTNPNRKGIPE